MDLTSLVTYGWDAARASTFALLPPYMAHQRQRRFADRFRRYVKREIFRGREALTVDAATTHQRSRGEGGAGDGIRTTPGLPKSRVGL